MKYDFDQFPDRRASECIKWRIFEEDVLPLWVADMDFVSPEPVINALRERVDHGMFGYPESGNGGPNELPVLKNNILAWLEERHGWKVEPDDLIFIPGVVTGLNLTCHAFAEPGGNVLVQTPVYPPFLHAPSHAGMGRQDALLTYRADGTYAIDWESFEAAINPETRLFILCNPHNPVGRVFTRQELQKMAEICLRHGVTICSDEIHGDLVFSGSRHLPIASLDPEIARNTITFMAPSKTFNLAGLECSFAVVQNPELKKKILHSTKGLVSFINIMGLTAARAAYGEGAEWLDELLVYLEANRNYLDNFVKAELPGVRMAKPEGTYLAWLDCREANLPLPPYRFFLEKARVALNDGATFGQGGEGFVRLNFGCPRYLLEEALERMKTALASK